MSENRAKRFTWEPKQIHFTIKDGKEQPPHEPPDRSPWPEGEVPEVVKRYRARQED